ncbi:metal cation symporter ZIP8 [Clupea harengus]|uniref:Metal cation symporter ZIP8 n=1 Tax=Clupea harengus TaxID=7950 RepID=A0A6P3VWK5_CLUHA|nr:metal cation symporter ZIP8 [Clupea harengus]
MPYLHGISLPPVPSRRNCKPFRYLDGGICRDFSMTALQSVILLTVISNQYLAEATPQSSFLQDVLRFYGENESLSTDNLNNFLQLITTRRPPSIDNEDNPLKNTECMSPEELLVYHGLGNVSELTLSQLEVMCPAFLTQVLLPACPYVGPGDTKPPASHVWGYGFLAVTLINLAALLGLFLVPFTDKPYFPKVLTYFIGLAIGTLFSNAVLQLIPEALGFDPKTDKYVLKAIGIFGGFYILFFVERVLKMALGLDHEHGHAPPPPQQNSEEKSDIITVTSFSHISLNNTNTINHSVTNSVANLINNDMTNGNPAAEGEQEGVVACHWLRGERIANIKTVAWMITLSDAVHNFIDGLAIGVSFTVSTLTGFSTSIAIVCEEFPHELGDFVILLNSGMSVPQAVFFNMLSAACCYLGLVLGIILGSNFAPNAIFAIAGGMFLYIALADMFPEMNNIMNATKRSSMEKAIFFLIQNAGLLTGFSIILLITIFAGEITLG